MGEALMSEFAMVLFWGGCLMGRGLVVCIRNEEN
jgi:hypothetical protein